MTVFYLKLLITPLLMLSISIAAKRWGTHVGGLLSGLPVTSAVVMLFLSLEQGPGFVAMAVPGALAGVAAIQATYLFYLTVTRRLSAFLGCVAALAFYVVAALLMNWLGSLPASIAVTLCLIVVLIMATSRTGERPAKPVPLPSWIIPMRMLTATLLLLLITAGAQWLGPVVSGYLAPIPIIAWPLAVFAHVQGGRQELAAIVRGNAIGAVGVIGFYLSLQGMLMQLGILPAVATGVVLAVVITAVVARLANLHRKAA
ncbi:hypothetical protein [Pseudomonas coleopterorum]|uniref:Uncharacterized protein n=1 Tax=Pseudomonas coleopterorum TaxID=1605838 RepID=A0AAJ6MTZ4_9PSED|nr:hypothetical protein [Pseudomonas coleopterorum]WNC10617.1 hypothetical protein RI108_04105 [Pseudomonas coleopterorum]